MVNDRDRLEEEEQQLHQQQQQQQQQQNNNKDISNIKNAGQIFEAFANIIRSKLAPVNENDRLERFQRWDKLYNNNGSNKGNLSNNQSGKTKATGATTPYDDEKKLIAKISNIGLTKGLACGLFTFVTIRTGGSMLRRYFLRRISNGGGGGSSNGKGSSSGSNNSGYTFDSTISSSSNATSKSKNPFLNHPSNSTNLPPPPNPPPPQFQKPGLFIRSINLGFDIMLSILAAIEGTKYFTNTTQILDDISSIPLVKGKSLISDELCSDFINVYRSIPKETWKQYEANDGEKQQGINVVIRTIDSFVRNCLRRKMVEKDCVSVMNGDTSSSVLTDDDGTIHNTNNIENENSNTFGDEDNNNDDNSIYLNTSVPRDLNVEHLLYNYNDNDHQEEEQINDDMNNSSSFSASNLEFEINDHDGSNDWSSE